MRDHPLLHTSSLHAQHMFNHEALCQAWYARGSLWMAGISLTGLTSVEDLLAHKQFHRRSNGERFLTSLPLVWCSVHGLRETRMYVFIEVRR